MAGLLLLLLPSLILISLPILYTTTIYYTSSISVAESFLSNIWHFYLLEMVCAKLFRSPGKDTVTMEKVLDCNLGNALDCTRVGVPASHDVRRSVFYMGQKNTVIADAAEKDIHGIATMAAHADTHAALSEREVPSIQNPAFSRFCHARRYSSYPAYRLGKMQQQVPSIPIPGLLSPLSSLTDCVGRTGRLTQPQSEREEAATGFIYSDVKPTVLPLETSTDDVPVNTDKPLSEPGHARGGARPSIWISQVPPFSYSPGRLSNVHKLVVRNSLYLGRSSRR
ncbi:hypothetical protein BO85DRAFT_514333 [Aspergillus piperis CBS 112811]|uniref:Uncharacterized protein n=1 Tax=Aspergillus piperis CBS 112811 TaxID=1448313 RepID=A0A8G1VL85_9EURO|nr:hypothetical protein BO85DRAFT_514333 [Aspergillus piperis CBS 112811]RAH57544.1 hypothetical protein BO85DRAFT_514333 [Aspergillus piperis CBS 112811]